MSQTDQDVANASGASVRADVNAHLDAIASNHSGATAPTTTFPNQWWLDTALNILKQRDNANTTWVNVASKPTTTWVPYRNGNLLGDASEKTVGTSGATVPLLNGINVWDALQEFLQVADTINDIGATGGGTQDIDVALGGVALLMVTTSANTFTFSNFPVTGKSGGVVMKIFTGGAQGVTWPVAMKWPAGVVPTLTDNTDVFTTDFATDDKLDVTAHSFKNGDRGQVTNSGGALPGGLAIDTLYFVVNASANDFEVSLTEGGAAVDITSNGTGTHTFHSGLDEILILSHNGGLTLEGFPSALDLR